MAGSRGQKVQSNLNPSDVSPDRLLKPPRTERDANETTLCIKNGGTWSPILPLLALFSGFLLLANAEALPSKPTKLSSRETPPLRLQVQRLRSGSSGKNVAAAGTNDTAADNEPFTTHYFPQELDHFTFTPNSSNIFYQKYLVNDTFWKRGAGPMFVYLGGEQSIEGTASGFVFDIAPKFGAMLVFIEHRFYGDSQPFGDDSSDNSSKTLGFLTSTQALADFAILITSLKQNLISAVDSSVVVFGGSYAGSSSTPHVAMGAVAASAPILLFDHITPWTGFYDTVSQDYKSDSLNCFSVIKAVWDVLDDRGSNDTGLQELSKTFKACETVQSIDSLSDWLQSAFTYTAMYDFPTIYNLPAYPVKEMCNIIDSFPAGADIIDKVFAAASLFYNNTGDQKCFQIEADEESLDGWDWQKIDLVLKRYGSNIIFSNGMRDPWSPGGVLKNVSSSIVALVTEKGAHCLDLISATDDDLDWLVEQRRQEVDIIQGWIDQYNQDIAQMSH